MKDKLYCYPPDYTVLKNLANIRDPQALEAFERNELRVQLCQPIPRGEFDLPHLQAIHKHLFKNVYEWAGEVREVEIQKSGKFFGFQQAISFEMKGVTALLRGTNYLRDLNKREFSDGAAQVIGDVNYIHPFREGNGRTQFQYLKQLGAQAGHHIDLSKFSRDSWIEASQQARAEKPDYKKMSECIHAAIELERMPQRLDPRAEKLREQYRDHIEKVPDHTPERDRGEDDRER